MATVATEHLWHLNDGVKGILAIHGADWHGNADNGIKVVAATIP